MPRFLSSVCLCILSIQVAFQVLQVEANPRSRDNILPDMSGNSISVASVATTTSTSAPPRTKPPCYESIPCGWAHYSTNNNRFRPIYHYTKNNICRCQSGLRCVLTDNRLDRKAYIFHCRHIESARQMYPFPELY